MLLEIAKETDVPASQEVCWELVSDVPRLSGCIPGVSDVRALEGGSYAATITDKLGPFRLQLPARISIVETDPPRRLLAELQGNEGHGLARVQGRLETALEPAGDGTRLKLNMHMEVLGRLASLGATPMRRRTDEIFAVFVERLRKELSG